MNDGHETIFRKGDEILGGKTKYSSRTGRDRPHRHDRVHPTGTGACQSMACYCSPLHGVSPTNPRAKFA